MAMTALFYHRLGPAGSGPTILALVNNVAATLEGLPADLAEFADVFSEKTLDTLPDHGSYNCLINIVKGARSHTNNCTS